VSTGGENNYYFVNQTQFSDERRLIFTKLKTFF